MINVSYVSRLPLQGDAPSVIIKENEIKNYSVEFIDSKISKLVTTKEFKSNEIVYGNRQWFTNWEINIYDENKNLIHTDKLNLKGKTVFIKLDARALGDTLAWIPYVELFRTKNKCNVVCSTFFNHIVKDVYPNILFVIPNTQMDNIYAQYYIGASDDGNEAYTPLRSGSFPLQKTASDILGFKHKELRPTLEKLVENSTRRIQEKYVCISEFGSSTTKMWKEGVEGWQKIVNYLNRKGYKVVVISKEKTTLNNIIDLSGNYSLYDRMIDLYHCEFFIGVSSGLSWLSWGLNKHVVMISDVTPVEHEFASNCTRISANNLNQVNYEIEGYSTTENVISKLKEIIKDEEMDKIKIGITIALNSINDSIWTNGMKLNILMFINLLNNSEKNYDVYLLNTVDIDITNKPSHLKDIQVDLFKDKYTEMDLIISMGSQITSEEIKHFKSIKPTNKFIAYKCGNNYILAIEELLFKEGPKLGYIYENEFDEIWYVPQQHENNQGYYTTLYRAKSIIVPFLWDKTYLNDALTIIDYGHQQGKYKKDSKYVPNKEQKVLAIMEPNLNIVKTCVIPSLIAEESYRGEIGKNKIEKLMITNSENVKTHKTFLSMLVTYDLYKDKKIRVESRYQTSYFLSQYADIVICHQIMNPLNYLYLDAAYMGYPVLHNAPMCKDLGYYYEGSSTKDGAKQLNWILENHDDNLEIYQERNRKVLERYSVDNQELIRTYDTLIENLFNGGNSEDLVYDETTNLYKNLF